MKAAAQEDAELAALAPSKPHPVLRTRNDAMASGAISLAVVLSACFSTSPNRPLSMRTPIDVSYLTRSKTHIETSDTIQDNASAVSVSPSLCGLHLGMQSPRSAVISRLGCSPSTQSAIASLCLAAPDCILRTVARSSALFQLGISHILCALPRKDAQCITSAFQASPAPFQLSYKVESCKVSDCRVICAVQARAPPSPMAASSSPTAQARTTTAAPGMASSTPPRP